MVLTSHLQLPLVTSLPLMIFQLPRLSVPPVALAFRYCRIHAACCCLQLLLRVSQFVGLLVERLVADFLFVEHLPQLLDFLT